MKILLTGSGGFIGKNIKESFLGEDYELITPRSYELNLLDTNAVDRYFEDKTFDVIIHAACKPGHRNAKDLTNLLSSNLLMFENLARHSDKYNKFINFGSGAVYNVHSDVTNATETELYKKIGKDDHSLCKYIISKRIDSLFKEGKSFVDLNIFGIFGKYEDWEIRFPSNAICKTIYDLPITIHQDRRFSYLDVNDLFPILKFFIENDYKHSSYNVCPDKSTSLLEIADIVRNISRKNTEIIVAKEGFGYDYTGCNERLHEEMGDLKFTNLDISLKNLYDYYETIKQNINRNLLLEDK